MFNLERILGECQNKKIMVQFEYILEVSYYCNMFSKVPACYKYITPSKLGKVF